MQISPVYDRALLTFDGGPPVGPAMVRQRRRFLSLLRGLTEDQWAAPTRCEDWTVQDVAADLAGVDGFWHASIVAGVAGAPTR